MRISDWSSDVCSSDLGGLGRKRKDGTVVDGVEIFDEIKAGDIRSGGFDLNGSWAPLYTVHKLFAGLLDINGAWGNRKALDVARSEERRVGKECVSTCRSRWSPSH